MVGAVFCDTLSIVGAVFSDTLSMVGAMFSATFPIQFLLIPDVLRVTCYVLRVTCYVLRVTSYVLHVTCYVLRLPSLNFTFCKVRLFRSLQFTVYSLHFTTPAHTGQQGPHIELLNHILNKNGLTCFI